MVGELNQLLEQIRNNIAAYQELGQLLAQSANDITSNGVPPSEELLAATASARAEFSLLKKKMLDMGLSEEGNGPPNSLKSMERIVEKRLAQEYEAAHQAKRNRLLPLLDKVNQIQAVTPLYEEALDQCKAMAGELKTQLLEMDYESLSASLGEIEQLMRPFLALLTLIETPEQLDDEDWLECNSIIEKFFGTSMALAASRKKLYLQAGPQSNIAPASEPIIPKSPSFEDELSIELPPPPTPAISNPVESSKGPRILLVAGLLLAALGVVAYLSQGSFPDGLTLRRQGILIKNINQPLENRDSYLIRAVKDKNLTLMSLLIKHGAIVNAQDADLNTPLHLAVLGGFLEGADLLIQNGADPSIKNGLGKTPGELALTVGNLDIANLLPEGLQREPRDMVNARNPFAVKQ